MVRAKRIREDKAREKRMDVEIVVDAYNETERAVSWYYWQVRAGRYYWQVRGYVYLQPPEAKH